LTRAVGTHRTASHNSITLAALRCLDAGEMREIELLWAAVLTSVAIALAVFWTTSAGEKRALRWTHR